VAGLTNPQRWNRYAYSLNSPIFYTDPSGLLAQGPPSIPSSFCGAEHSFGSCGGDDYFWGSGDAAGFGFGGGIADARRSGYVTGMPDAIWAALQGFNARVADGFAANAANAALRSGDRQLAAEIVRGNDNLLFITVPEVNVREGMTYQQAVDEYLKGWGLWDLIDPGSMTWAGNGYTFSFKNTAAAEQVLSNPAFAQGFLGILHRNEVGPNRDFRTWPFPTSPHSLQVTWGTTGRVYADIDRYNPYDVAGFVQHGLREVAPWFKKAWPW
jgi:hypothetical protein